MTDSGPGTVIYTTGSTISGIDNYIERDGPWTGITDLVSYRERLSWGIHLAKLIALGSDCIDLHDSWSTPATTTFTALS